MSMGQTPLFCVLALVLQLNLATAAVAAGCPLHPTVGHPSCNETCSKPPRIPFSDWFNCGITGYFPEWYDFKSRYKLERATRINTPNPTECKLPVISAMSLHPLSYRRNRSFSPALNITFNVPFIGQEAKPELKAILLEFESPLFTKTADKMFTDNVYSIEGSGKIYRLFNFSSYQPDSYDLDNPININYACLYGLDDCNNGEKVYTITLSSLLSTMTNSNRGFYKCTGDTCSNCSLTYTFSVYTVRYNNWNYHRHTAYNREYEKWNMTIATALYPSPNDIYVILEPRSVYDVYTIRLIRDGHVIKSKDTTETTYIFKDVSPGTYKVQIEASMLSGKTELFTTYHSIIIRGKGAIGEKDDQHSIITVVAASVLGISLAILLLIILAWLKCRVKKSSQRAYIMLSSGDRASAEMSIVMKNALWNLDIKNVGCPKNMENLLRSLNKENGNVTLIILIPVEHETFQFQISKDVEFEQTIEYLAKYEQLKIILIYFPYVRHYKSLGWKMLRKGTRICLMEDYDKMIKLLNIKNRNSPRTLEKVKSDLTQATEEARQVLMTYCETPPKPFDSLKEQNKPCPIHRPHNTDFPMHQRYAHNPNPMFYLENENGLNNDLRYVDYYDNRPRFGEFIIPPSPSPSTKGNQDPEIVEERVNTESSGYETSQIHSSSDNNNTANCLEDDASLNEQIRMINEQHLHENSGEHIPLELVSSPSFPSEETESEDRINARHRGQNMLEPLISNQPYSVDEETDSVEERLLRINFG